MTAKKSAHKKPRRLSPAEEKLKFHIKKSYSDFWQKKYSCGWIKPLFQYEEVTHLLEIAAQASAHIRLIYENEHPGADPNTLAGRTHEYLWSLDQHPKTFADKFVREMVHHTFKDEQGFFEGLNEKRIDRILDKYLRSHNLSIPSEDVPTLLETLKTSWLDVDRLMHSFISEADPEQAHVLTGRVKRVIRSLKSIEQEVQDWFGHSPKQIESETSSVADQSDSSPSPSTPLSTEPQEPVEPSQDPTVPQTKTDEQTIPTEKVVGEGHKDSASQPEPDSDQKASSDAPNDEKKIQLEPQSDEKDEKDEKEAKEAQGIPIEVVKVTEEVQSITSEVKSLIDRTELLKFEDLVKNPEEGVKEIETYQKQCLKYSEMLMRDLLSLDQLQLTNEARPARKKIVQNIQQLLDNLDAITVQLRTQLKKIKDQQREEEERKKAEEQAKREKEEKEKLEREKELKAQLSEQERKQKEEHERKVKEENERKQKEERERKQREEQIRKQREEEARKQREERERQLREAQERERRIREEQERERSSEEPKVPAERQVVAGSTADLVSSHQGNLEEKRTQIEGCSNKWSLIKLRVDFEVNEKRDCYLMSAYIPNMEEKDIHITLHNNNTILKIEGLRCPTPEEEAIMMKKLDYFLPNISLQDKQMYLLRLGAGQFGKFSESYRVPQDVDVEQIKATYRRGVIQIVLSKRTAHYAPPPIYSPFVSPFEVPRARTHASSPSSHGRSSFPFDFFNDPDLWWN